MLTFIVDTSQKSQPALHLKVMVIKINRLSPQPGSHGEKHHPEKALQKIATPFFRLFFTMGMFFSRNTHKFWVLYIPKKNYVISGITVLHYF